jgi:hypothetical protein
VDKGGVERVTGLRDWGLVIHWHWAFVTVGLGLVWNSSLFMFSPFSE